MSITGEAAQTNPPSQETPSQESGRSLWQEATRRLRANRAAMISIIVLAFIALLSVVGPWIAPHDYDAVYRNYVKVPASLEAHPRADDVEKVVTSALKRARVNIESVQVSGNTVSVAVTSKKPIDARVSRYLDRADILSETKVTDKADDGLRLVLEARITRLVFVFGTDSNGRDLLARTLVAGRISLLIGLLATLVALFIGVTYGSISGYLGGRVDIVMMRVVDILYSLPFIFFVILLMVFFGRNFVLIFIAVGAIEWLDMARIVRGQALALKRQEFVQAAEALGVETAGILRRHIVPNTAGPVVIYMTLMVPKVILLESFLSFLGLGVQEPMTSWGVLISEGARNIQGAPWMLIFPSLFLTMTLLCLNFIGDGLRDALDPKER